MCNGCDDTRPRADELHKGWRFRSPFGRWETVERVAQANEYATVFIWTQETPARPWEYAPYRRLDARRPEETYGLTGAPELRAVELTYHASAPMYVVATLDRYGRSAWQEREHVIVEASYSGTGRGWVVVHRPDAGGEQAVERCDSKAAARSTLRRLGREYARRMGVRFTIEAAQ